MKFPISYNRRTMTLHVDIGKYHKYLQCPFATWWKARKYFRKPKFHWYFGPMKKYIGEPFYTKFGKTREFIIKGYWPMASTEYLKWRTPKWFPIHVMSSNIMWKDKYDSPRYERPGYFIIFFGRDYETCWQLSLVITAPEVYCNNECTNPDHQDNYWESMLWYLNYADQYSEDKKTVSLIEARRTFRNNHWTSHKSISLDDYEILQQGFKELNIGLEEDLRFYYLDIKSDKLFKLIKRGRYSWDINNKLLSDVEISIRVTPREQGDEFDPKTEVYEHTEYIRVKTDKDSEEDDKYEYVRLFFKNKDGKLATILNTSYENIDFNYLSVIDLGPSFKDEFLNKRGVAWVRGYYRRYNEDGTLKEC